VAGFSRLIFILALFVYPFLYGLGLSFSR